MALIRWQPFPELIGMRSTMDRLLADRLPSTSVLKELFEHGMEIPLDVYETPEEVVVKASLPGMKPEKIDVSLDDGILTIKGEQKEEKETKEEKYFIREHRYGKFTRSLIVPVPVAGDKAEAEYHDGLLTLTLPKAKKSEAKKINIKAKEAPETK